MKEAILLVDDDEDTRVLVCEGLRRRGFSVQTVESGQACLELLHTSRVDIVVTDVQMPGMSGIELCSALRDQYPSLLSIVVTSLRDLKTSAAVIASGAFAFMSKPVKLAALDVTIRRALAFSKRRAERRVSSRV